MDDYAYLDERIEKTKLMIAACEDAVLAISSGNQMYQLDTGQTRILVQKSNLASVKNMIEELENRLAVLNARRYGAGYQARPTF